MAYIYMTTFTKKTKKKKTNRNDWLRSQDKEKDVEEEEFGQGRKGESGEKKEEEDRGQNEGLRRGNSRKEQQKKSKGYSNGKQEGEESGNKGEGKRRSKAVKRKCPGRVEMQRRGDKQEAVKDTMEVNGIRTGVFM